MYGVENVLVVHERQNINGLSMRRYYNDEIVAMRNRCNAVAREYDGVYMPLTLVSESVNTDYDNEIGGSFTTITLIRRYRLSPPAEFGHDDYMRILHREHEAIINAPNRFPEVYEAQVFVRSFKDT